MPLDSNSSLLHYRLLAQIGEGGMGVVWKATDTTLERDVAIKILPEQFAADPERLARFEREAKLLASLNHPNIAAVYGLHEAEGVRFLVMELVDGEDLAERLSRGPMGIEAGLAAAGQIASALEAAHTAGVIHRDLKPANVRINNEGQIKVLDFGLAKAMDPTPAERSHDPAQSPTITSAGTVAGMLLGTAAYMSPEQARGETADHRADIWGFGCLLFEMLTGKRPFAGNTLSDTLASVLKTDPDWSLLPEGTSEPVRRMLRRCLVKDRKQRLHHIADARLELSEPAEPVEAGAGTGTVRSTSSTLLRLVAVVAVLATVLAVWGWMRPSEDVARQPTRLTIALPTGEELQDAPAISRDGRTIAYVSQLGMEPKRLWVRALDDFERRPVPGSEDARIPFFSPDGRSIAFIADGDLKVVELAGGTPRIVAPAPSSFGATWLDDDRIVFTATINSGLLAVPATGGEVQTLTTPDLGATGYAHVWPKALPGGNHVLFTIWGGQDAEFGGSAVYSFETGEYVGIRPDYGGGSWSTTGHLLVPADSEVDGDFAALRAAPYQVGDTEVGGEERTVLENIYGIPWREQPWMSIADNGTLAYVPGTVADRRIAWYDRDGSHETAVDSRAVHDNLALSPDGRQVVVKNSAHLWVHDLESATRIRLTSEPTNGGPLWDPDGKRIYFSSNRGGDWDLYVKSADGTGEAELLWKRDYSQWTNSIAPDGTLLIEEVHPESGLDLWTLKPGSDPEPFLITPENEEDAAFSPDGRLVAYTTNESGRPEIYLLPYPGPGGRVPVSREGGERSKWSPDGRRLYYFQGDAVMEATIQREPELKVLQQRKLFTGKFLSIYSWGWDIGPDGRFLMIERGPGSVPDRIHVVLDWASEL